VQSVWTSKRAVSLHVALALFVPGCVALTWWQVSRALGGNSLSWVYTFEWPIFAGYATYMWWKLVHDDAGPAPGAGADPTTRAESGAGAGAGASPGVDPLEPDEPDEPDDELAAYNRYLAQLHASGRQKRW
jgi:hypothetical protein